MPPSEITGLSLRVARVEARAKAKDIAALMGVSRSRITKIEREGFVSEAIATRYLEALRTFRKFGTSGE
jgi:DNA-binding XRE family transcriptional regulator